MKQRKKCNRSFMVLLLAFMLTGITGTGFVAGGTVAKAAEGEVGCNVNDCTGSYENGFCKKVDTHYQPAVLNGNNVYEISNAGQLYWFAAKVNSRENSIGGVLKSDIYVNKGDLSGYDGVSENNWREPS